MKSFVFVSFVLLVACGQAEQEAAKAALSPNQKASPTAEVTTTEAFAPAAVSTWNTFFVADASNLPVCSYDREGQLFYVGSEQRFYACQSNDWQVVEIKGKDGQAGERGQDGETIVGPQGERGERGEAGIPGLDGASCSAARAEGGVNVTCGSNAPVFVADGVAGEAGRDGIDGTSCTAARVAGGANITCGSNAPVFVADGAVGATGATGATGAAGVAGTSCTAARTTGGVNVTCGSNAPVFLPDGAVGATGPATTLVSETVCSSFRPGLTYPWLVQRANNLENVGRGSPTSVIAHDYKIVVQKFSSGIQSTSVYEKQDRSNYSNDLSGSAHTDYIFVASTWAPSITIKVFKTNESNSYFTENMDLSLNSVSKKLDVVMKNTVDKDLNHFLWGATGAYGNIDIQEVRWEVSCTTTNF